MKAKLKAHGSLSSNRKLKGTFRKRDGTSRWRKIPLLTIVITMIGLTAGWFYAAGIVSMYLLVGFAIVAFFIFVIEAWLTERQLERFAVDHLGKGFRGRSDLCFSCGYDLTHGKSLACPECGVRAASRLIELRR